MRFASRDVLLLVVLTACTATGACSWIVGDDRRTAAAVTALFGLCTAVAAWSLLEQVRSSRSASRSAPVADDALAGAGPVKQDRRRIAVGGAALALVGAVMTWGGGRLGWGFLVCAGVIGATGLAFLVGLATGWVGGRWFAFEPEGLRFGERRFDYLVHWDNVADVQVGDRHGVPVVHVQLRDLERAAATAPPAHRDALRRRLRQGLGWTGAPVTIFAAQFPIDAGLLARSIAGYAADPGRRAHLAQGAVPG